MYIYIYIYIQLLPAPKLLSQPHKHLRDGKTKHNSGEQPTVDCTLKPIQRCGVITVYREGHFTFEPEPAGNT